LSRLNEDPDLANNVEIVLPRVVFEITNYSYDATRKIGAKGEFLLARIGNDTAKVFNPVPYDITFQLHTLCKNQEDSLQLLEQILPYFAPSMTINIELIPALGIKKDVPIEMSSVDVVDTYEGSTDDFRTVTQTFTFVAQMDLFGPVVSNRGGIKTSIIDIGTNYANDNISLQYMASVNPQSANKPQPHSVDETWNYQI
jgi:hypothetical protein